MEPRLDHRSVIATIRGMVDDNVAFTSSELAVEFTLADVARRLGTSRGAVRRVFDTVSEAAEGVRLQKMEELFDRWDAVERSDLHPSECFRAFCDHLAEYEAHHFFVDSEAVFRVFEDRACATFAEIASDGAERGVFDVADRIGAAQFAFDVLRLMAIQARIDDAEISWLPTADCPMGSRSTYENHLSLVLRSWGWFVRH